MQNRRDFIKKAGLLAGAAGMMKAAPASILKALSIDPLKGSTYLDAEHVVILMQENRSFDHCYGTLNGVRGFNDPRAIELPDKNKVWFQTNHNGETYSPFRLNIKETKSTFTGSLPHSWPDQVDARNKGCYDQWLIAKPSHYKGLEHAPLTMGYYNRQDLPFYYALADAFTVCDQNFCSSLTGTTPNRLYLWSGAIKDPLKPTDASRVSNGDTDYDKQANWTSFPEILEEQQISWKVYQNEISIESGLTPEEDDWLSNFTDNPLEWFQQYQVRFSATHVEYLKKLTKDLPGEIQALQKQYARFANKQNEEAQNIRKQIDNKNKKLEEAKQYPKWSKEKFDSLSEKQKDLHRSAFTTNKEDQSYRKLASYSYNDDGHAREMAIPAGDILHQFRKDVEDNNLPAVSWVIGSANFSDHPGSPWYGAWYVSEVLDILTHNPELWKKTIFILCYDENDGYFDHVPPFVAPDPLDPTTGKVSAGIDISNEYVHLSDDLKRTDEKHARQSAIGLGYRVPLVIASPWSRGGNVCSEVFDHTSILQFLEHFLSAKTGKQIRDKNMSTWRRTICGDLSAVFKPYNGERLNVPPFLTKEFYSEINRAQYKKDPDGFKALHGEELVHLNYQPGLKGHQEKGMRKSLALPYELFADAEVRQGLFVLQLKVGNNNLRSKGAPFTVYDYSNEKLLVRDYAVKAGDTLIDDWPIKPPYHVRVNGPNGFMREFKEGLNEIALKVSSAYNKNDLEIIFENKSDGDIQLRLQDQAYGARTVVVDVKKSGLTKMIWSTKSGQRWYDVLIDMANYPDVHSYRFAGRVENGEDGVSDPAMA